MIELKEILKSQTYNSKLCILLKRDGLIKISCTPDFRSLMELDQHSNWNQRRTFVSDWHWGTLWGKATFTLRMTHSGWWNVSNLLQISVSGFHSPKWLKSSEAKKLLKKVATDKITFFKLIVLGRTAFKNLMSKTFLRRSTFDPCYFWRWVFSNSTPPVHSWTYNLWFICTYQRAVIQSYLKCKLFNSWSI